MVVIEWVRYDSGSSVGQTAGKFQLELLDSLDLSVTFTSPHLSEAKTPPFCYLKTFLSTLYNIIFQVTPLLFMNGNTLGYFEVEMHIP